MRSLIIFFAALFLSGTANAEVIDGCVKNNNGALRIVADPSDCNSREMHISWNQQGAPGADAEVLHVFDRNGVDLGIFSGGGLGAVSIFSEAAGVLFDVDQDGTLVRPPGATILYEDPGCDNTAPLYVQPDFGIGGAVRLTHEGLTTVENGVAPVITRIGAAIAAAGEPCSPGNQDVLVIPARVAELGLTFPLPTPLYVAPAP